MPIVTSLLAFASYFFIGFAMVLAFLFIYTRVTPHDEWALIKENNGTAAIGFGGALIGYVIPLSSAAINSVSLVDYITWGVVALVVQLLIYFAVRLYMPRLSQRYCVRCFSLCCFAQRWDSECGVYVVLIRHCVMIRERSQRTDSPLFSEGENHGQAIDARPLVEVSGKQPA